MKKKMNLVRILLIGYFLIFNACNSKLDSNISNTSNDSLANKFEIAAMLDSFNLAAANAEYENYFNFFADDAIFMGTDATEHWDKPAYMKWAKPFFDKKHAWNFNSVDRHIYFSQDGKIAWFDELLDAPFAVICRGSGVVSKESNGWKIHQYVLSMTIPNTYSDKIRGIKAPIEDSLLNTLKK
jgi:ketosteroid isomerase-like protein